MRLDTRVAQPVNLGIINAPDALFVLEAVARHPDVDAFPGVVEHLRLMLAIADRKAALERVADTAEQIAEWYDAAGDALSILGGDPRA